MSEQRLVALGLSHHTAPLALREQLRCTLAELSQAASRQAVAAAVTVSELVLLSTCNRLELVAVVDVAGDWRHGLATLLGAPRQIDPAAFWPHLQFYEGEIVARHLCRVAAGLDSLILGEAQILGQVNEAHLQAMAAGTSGPTLQALFHTALRAGKRARTETAIGHNPASTSSIALAQAEQILGDLRRQSVLVIGVGQMGQLALKGLHARRIERVAVANRSPDRAAAVARRFGVAQVVSLADLPAALAQTDVVISATAAPGLLIDASLVAEVMARRPARPLVLLDIAVPRDIDPAVQDLPGVHFCDADMVQNGLDEALAARQNEVPRVEEIVAAEVACFDAQLRELAMKPVIADLRQKAECIRQQELQRALRHLGEVDAETLTQMQHLSRSLVNKLLHEPTRQLRAKAQADEAATVAAAVRELFGLTATPEQPPQ